MFIGLLTSFGFESARAVKDQPKVSMVGGGEGDRVTEFCGDQSALPRLTLLPASHHLANELNLESTRLCPVV